MKFICSLLFAMLCVGCSYSVREQITIEKIPVEYRNWQGGIRSSLTDKEVEDALALGNMSKDSNEIYKYAYIHKLSGFATSYYVTVKTPSYLIAEHAAAQAKEYRAIDKDYVEFCRNLELVAVTVSEQTVNNLSLTTVQNYVPIILLNGTRVEPTNKEPTYDGSNPFVNLNPNIKKMYKDSMAIYKRQMESLTPEQKLAFQKQFGVSPTDAMPLMPGASLSGNLFNAKDLASTGVYEIIIHPLQTPGIGGSLFAENEKRIPIELKRFK